MFDLKTGKLTPKAAKKNVVAFAHAKGKLSVAARMVDAQTGKGLSASLKGTRFDGNAGEMHKFTGTKGPVEIALLVGLGKPAGVDRATWWKTGLAIGKQLDGMGVKEATIALGDGESSTDAAEASLALVEGIHMAMYRFDTYKSELKEGQKPRFKKLTILTTAPAAKVVAKAWPKTRALLEGTDLTRTMANLPPNVCNPQMMADEANKLSKLGVKIEVLDEKQLAKLGCNLILAVGANATKEDQPRIVLMHYNGAGKNAPLTAIVGKGVMYDTGGYSLKPPASMKGMKFDMSGAAAVLGTMRALAARKAKVNVVGVMTCAMNMIGGVAYVPDSIYKGYKGITVEIGNTDAEGRLCLADAVAYTIDKHKPAELVDLATLTGAVMVALGGGYAGLFSNKDSLANALSRAAHETGERLWRLPVDDYFMNKSSVADISNDSMGPWGGASVAAAFIKKFIGRTTWAHLDIAGVANAEKIAGGNPHMTGATGFGVRLLVNWLEGERSIETADDEKPVKRGRGRPRKKV